MLKGFFQKIGSAVGGRKIDEDLLEELEEQLIMGDVSIYTTQHLIDRLRQANRRGEVSADDGAQAALQTQVIDLLGGDAVPLHFAPEGLTVWLIVGVNGVGKTTTIGKLAKRLQKQGHRTLLVAGDTFRAAAIEQLQEWGRRSGCEVVAQQQGADPAAVVYDAVSAARSRKVDLLIVDTAGRLHTKVNLMEELRKVRRVADREPGKVTEVLLVLDATTGQNAVLQGQAFKEATGLDGLVIAKLDGTAKGGVVFAIVDLMEVPVLFVGTGEKVGDLSEFDPQAFVRALFKAA
jgi:fused signal recognition particle receptor